MPGNSETNVRLAPCALEALSRIVARRGASRDETVRQLLAEHVALQEQVHPEDRLTHISTVLRYPRPPRWRGDPRTDVPLRVRAPAGLLERARAASLLLPGQHPRAYRDYQGRILTDAVTTAIARDEPFDDAFLTGLLPLVRHGAALGLWRLATAVTSTRPEKAWLLDAESVRAEHRLTDNPLGPAGQHILRVAEALEQEESWHAPMRFAVATALARRFLTGSRAQEREAALCEQGKPWEQLYQGYLKADDRHERRWRRRSRSTSYDWTGRGGTAVWRAQRRVDLEYLEDWLVGRSRTDPAAGVMEGPASPGWLLGIPPDWLAHAPAPAASGPYATWAGEGRILAFPYRNRQAFWPLLHRAGALGHQPVPGFEPIAAAAAGMRPGQVLGFIEAVLIDWNHVFPEEPRLRIVLDVPADEACRFGLITSEDQHRLMAEARAATLQTMEDFITWAVDDGADPLYLRKLREARGAAREFHRLTRRYPSRARPKFLVHRPSWTWPGRSVAAELVAGSPPDLLQWLAASAHRRSTLTLEQASEAAWHRAFDTYGFRM
ncbi:hypothetical protein [Streptomyces sp. B1-3]|uniref:hypothetical protein n=1 Tax=Streptomyces sp. B1-3 TaxID=3141453 RepID=UPI003D2959E3